MGEGGSQTALSRGRGGSLTCWGNEAWREGKPCNQSGGTTTVGKAWLSGEAGRRARGWSSATPLGFYRVNVSVLGTVVSLPFQRHLLKSDNHEDFIFENKNQRS